MKSLLSLALLSLFTMNSSIAQNIVPHREFGISLGTGYGVDFGYGKIAMDDPFHENGIVYLVSIYIPYFGKHDPDGEEGYFNWFVPTTQVSQQLGISGGVRYLYDQYSLGIMADWLSSTTYQNYISTATGLTWHTAGVNTDKWGITFTTTLKVDENWGISVFAGTQRKFMIGALFMY